MPKLDIRKVHRVSKTRLDEFPITIGRSSSNSLVLHDTRVSRHHCVIEVVDGVARVRDLDSHLGTKLNGRKITVAALSNGDHLRVGPYELVYKDPNAPDADDDLIEPMHMNGRAGDTDLIPIDSSGSGHGDEQTDSGELLLSSSGAGAEPLSIAGAAANMQLEEEVLRERLARQEMEQQLQDVQKQLQAMQEQRQALESLQTQWTEERSRLIGDLQSKDAEVARERAEIQEKFEADLLQHRSRVDELERSIAESENEHASLITQCERFESERASAESRLAELRDHLAHLEHEAELARQHAHTLESERDRAVDLERAIDDSQQERQSLHTLCAQLQDDRSAAESRMVEVEAQLTELHRQVEAGRDAALSLAQERQRAAELEQRAQEAWQQQSELQLRFEQMVNERNGMTARIREMEASAQRWRSQADAAKEELAAKTAKLDQLASLASTLQTQLEQLEQQTSQALSDADDIQPDDDRAQVQEILYDGEESWSSIPQSDTEESRSVAAMLKLDPGEVETRTVDSPEQASALLGSAMPGTGRSASVNTKNYAGPIDFLRESVDRIRALAEERDRLASVQRRSRRRKVVRMRLVLAGSALFIILVCLLWWFLSRNG